VTEDQRVAIAAVAKELRSAFERAKEAMSSPGNARNWFMPYFRALLRAYYKLRKRSIGGSKLLTEIADDCRGQLLKLIERTTDRDPKTRSRWAAALANAIEAKVKPKKLRAWLKQGGGIAGRAKNPA
jgi:hypothetical protein